MRGDSIIAIVDVFYVRLEICSVVVSSRGSVHDVPAEKMSIIFFHINID